MFLQGVSSEHSSVFFSLVYCMEARNVEVVAKPSSECLKTEVVADNILMDHNPINCT